MAISINSFNKVGARLLQKQPKIKLEEQIIRMGGEPFSLGKKMVHGVKPPQNAATASYVQVERGFGKETCDIVSFFDDKGNLIQRNRFVQPSGSKQTLESISEYKRKPTCTTTHNDEVTVNEESFQRHTQSFKPNGKIKRDSFSNLTIDYQRGIYTKTDSALMPNRIGIFESADRNPELPGTLHLADEFQTKIQQWSKQAPRKIYERTIIYNPSTGCFTPIHSKGQNLTQNEINLLNQDKYIPLRFHPKLNHFEYIKKDAFAQQHIPLDTKIEYEKIGKDTRTRTAAYVKDNDPSTVYVVYRDGCQKSRPYLHSTANDINHESRHIWQHRLVDALNNNKIKDPELKKTAEALRDSFNKPRIRAEQDLDGYMNQVHEQDAFNIGNAVGDAVYQGYNNLRQVFKNIRSA